MKREWIKLIEKETAIKIRNTKVEAIRKKEIVKKGVRVYENGKIGISGSIGDVPDSELIKQAEDNLSVQIDYPFELESHLKEHRQYNSKPMQPDEILEHTESILKTLREEYPEFDFSETVQVKEITYSIENTEGLDLKYEDAFHSIGLLLKDKKSANLFDGFLINAGRRFDLNKFWEANRPLLKAYKTPVELPETNKMPVIFLGTETFSRFLNQCFNGESYALGSSLFSGKKGEKLFSDRVNIIQNSNPEEIIESFFDSEGVIQKDDKYSLVENGVLKNVFTDKRTASKFNLPHTGAASGAYDGMPTLSATHLKIEPDTTDLKAVLGGKPAIVVIISAGGDFTPDGDYAAPVQVSFLYDGENLLGKLPEINIRGNLFDIFGKNYMGTFENDYFYLGDHKSQIIVAEMEVSK